MNSLPQPTRRTLLRAAAWSVPAVTVAAAAPAFAASNTFASLAIGGADWDVLATPTRLQVFGIHVRTADSAAVIPAGGLAVTVTFPNHFVTNVAGSAVNVIVEDVSYRWQAGSPTYYGSGNSRYATVTFTYQNELQPGGGLFGGTTLLDFRAGRDAVFQPSLNESPLPISVAAAGFTPLSGAILVVD
ncbi:hypothetical protein IEQ44_09250 [Nocardioides sp. Y6]|uniref:Uncharacterized protein n=1 Tax=Nocardioides malaquae TaxID=2773426 RepID=A0ABR9RUN1_9ACTN|nr:hypothetical protein [Nocardioides malaquae]MBE7324840.1 hypothetical protein [Nocardioides malaquae]